MMETRCLDQPMAWLPPIRKKISSWLRLKIHFFTKLVHISLESGLNSNDFIQFIVSNFEQGKCRKHPKNMELGE